MQYGGDQAANSNGLTNGHQSRPVTATSIYSQESGYPDENASSTWDSRSLGRDSALGPYMASSNHHATRGNNGFHGAADTPDRPNPFHQGSNIASEADNVVQMFLMNMNPSLTTRPPGRIEDLPSPTSTIPSVPIAASTVDDVDSEASAAAISNRTVISQLRRNFFNKKEEEIPTVEPAKTNKYLRPENRWSRPEPQPPPPEVIGLVQGFVAPQMHHAEVVHVRQDSTSTEASLPGVVDEEVPGLAERNFEDPAFINFKAEQERQDINENDNIATAPPPTAAKKKGFLASIFKKSSSKKQTQSHHEEVVESDIVNYVDDIDEDNASEPAYEYDEVPKVLNRKRSMSKPTDLDEILRMQEALEKEQSVHEVFANDPFFQTTLKEYNIPLPSEPTHFHQGSGGLSSEVDIPIEMLVPPVPSRAPIENFSYPIANEPIYENHQQKPMVRSTSMDTTQEIDIDAILGYADEKAIENIEWPSQELPQQQEPGIHVQIDYNADLAPAEVKPQKSKRGGLFSFVKRSKKKPGKNDEVSYYIEEPQPEPMEEPPLEPIEAPPLESIKEPPFEPVEEPLLEPIEEPPLEPIEEPHPNPSFEIEPIEADQLDEEERRPQSTTSKKSSKPGFFKFKSKKGKKQPLVAQPSPLDDSIIEPSSSPVASSGPERVKSPFFTFKGKRVNANIPDHDNIVTEALNQDSVPHDEVPSEHEIAEQADAIGDSKIEKTPNTTAEAATAELAELAAAAIIDNDATDIAEAPDSSDVPEPDENLLGPIREEKPSFVTQQLSITDSSIDNSPPRSTSGTAKRSKKFGGISSLFKPSNTSKGNPKQIGTMAPVDISHLIDEEEPENLQPAEELKVPDDRPTSQASSSTLPGPERSRQRQKSSSGFANFFGPAKPRPSSQARQKGMGGRLDNRSRSLPRQKSAPSSQFPKQQPPSSAVVEDNSVPSPTEREQRRPPPKSKSLGGLFSVQPRRPRGPPPSPPPPPQEQGEPTRVSGSSTSLASRQRRDSKGLSNFLGTSPLRKSNRMPRSATFPTPPVNKSDQEIDPLPVEAKAEGNNVDKIELAPNQPAVSVAGSNAGNEPAASDPRRVKGRQR